MPKYMTIVFDDGPREPMCKIVDKFKSFGFSAGFAVVGDFINDDTQYMLEYAVKNGCELASHSKSHPRLEKLETRNEVTFELDFPIKEVEKRIGYKITTARLPFITFNDEVLDVARELNLALLGNGIDGGSDWDNNSTPEFIANAVLSTACDGAVACLHVTERTLLALDKILPELKERGYVLVTPSKLFEIKGLKEISLGININNVNEFV